MSVLHFGKRLGAFFTAAALIEVVNHLFDYVVAPGLIIWLGARSGGVAFFVAAFAMNYMVVLWYKRTSTDWFGAEWLRLQEDVESGSMMGKLLKSLLRRARPLAYIALCIYDPCYGFIYICGRKSGSQFTSTDWIWFVMSNIIGIMVWIGLVTSAIEGIGVIL